jgi:ribosomal protein L24E
VEAAPLEPGPVPLEAMCGPHRVIRLPDGRALCTHGADPAPDGVDVRVAHPLVPGQAQGLLFPDPPGGAPTFAATTPGIACYGDGTDGNRVQAIYAFPSGRPDRYNQALPYIRQWAAETDAVFQSSAAQTGGTRRVRFVTDQNCDLSVLRVPLTAQGDDTFDNTIAELEAQGYDHSDRKYLVWMDSTVLCGIATYYIDDRPAAGNFNNGGFGIPGSVARVDAGCWGLGSRGDSVEAHELMHNLGGVQPTAPNSTVNGHCDDDDDRMCYADGSPLLVLRSVCDSDQEALFDCNHDDYFSTAAPAGNYLATHWNTAGNSFLEAQSTSPTVTIADASVTEGDGQAVHLVFPVPVSATSSQPVTVRFTTADGSARAPDDYAATNGTLTFSPGETSKAVTVSVGGDVVHEPAKTLTVELTSPANATLQRSEAFGTIIDNDPAPQTRPEPREGYRFVAADGGIFAFGEAPFYGSTGSTRLNQPIVGMAATPTGRGYWLVAADGGIFAFGDARFFGSTGNIPLSQPIVGMAATPTGNGYWFVARDGGIFAFGDAPFAGSTGAMNLNQPIVGMAADPDGDGYWFVASDGGIFAFNAPFFGSTGAMKLNKPIVGMAPTPTGQGYYLVASDGGIFAFGDAKFRGSTGAMKLNKPIVGMAAARNNRGYWLVASDGGIFAFGNGAEFFGSTGNINLAKPIVGMGAAPNNKGYWFVAADGGIFAFGDAVAIKDPKLGGSPVVGLTVAPDGKGLWITRASGEVNGYGSVPTIGSLPSAPAQPIVGIAALDLPGQTTPDPAATP